jgi:peptidoglycan-N-acetylglucosamine deacetylase
LFKKYVLPLLLLTLLTHASFAEKREIAITIDDLPFVGESKNFHLNMIIEAFKNNNVPATGFVIAGNVKADNWKVLQKFHEAGLALGNHTLSHKNLNKVNPETYIQEIDTADKILAPVLTTPKFFRYPYLAMSNGDKKEKILHFLASKNYQVAPITIDSKDFIFNQLLLSVPESQRRNFLAALKQCYLDFIWQQTLRAMESNRLNHKPDHAQILLIHSNLLNAYVLPDIINLYKQNDYTFVSLDDALKTFSGSQKSPEQPKNIKNEGDIESFIAWD